MMTAGVVSVPIYPTLPAEQIRYLLEHSESRVIFVSTEEQLEKILSIWDHLPALEGMVIFDSYESDDERITALATLLGEKPLSEDEREDFEQAISAVQPQDLSSVIYTSARRERRRA